MALDEVSAAIPRDAVARNAELSRPPKGDRFELLVLPERSEGKEFDTAQLRIPPERSEGGTSD